MPRLGEDVRDLEAIRAINAARYARPRGGSTEGRQPRPFWVYTYREGLVVKEFLPKQPYVNLAAGKRVKFSHVARFGWMAWRDGKPVMMCIRYVCGGHTTSPTLSDSPTHTVCPKCRVVLMGYEEAAIVLGNAAQE